MIISIFKIHVLTLTFLCCGITLSEYLFLESATQVGMRRAVVLECFLALPVCVNDVRYVRRAVTCGGALRD